MWQISLSLEGEGWGEGEIAGINDFACMGTSPALEIRKVNRAGSVADNYYSLENSQMYLLRRIWKCKPGEARRVASLVQKQAQIYHEAGQRSEFRVYFNGYTTPTDPDTVVLEWTDEALMSPMRGGHQLPQDALAVGAQVRELTEGNRLEIMELMTPTRCWTFRAVELQPIPSSSGGGLEPAPAKAAGESVKHY